MAALPSLPPAFRLVVVARDIDAFDHACRRAPQGVADATVYWTERADRLQLAIVLEPDEPLRASLPVVHVLTVAVGDALGALLPPGLPFACRWPAILCLDGARLGTVRAAAAPTSGPDALPAWLVLGLRVDVGPYAGEPGEVPDRTTLADAGAPEITTVALAEAVSRHFLAWVRRWQEDGFAPVRAAWNARAETGSLDTTGSLRAGDAILPLEAALADLASDAP